jgi:SAM-dependent methyltransferase
MAQGRLSAASARTLSTAAPDVAGGSAPIAPAAEAVEETEDRAAIAELARPGSEAVLVCRACGAAGREAFLKRGYVIAACDRCGTQFVPEPLAEAEPYGEQYFDERAATGYADYLRDRELIVRNFERRIRWLAPLARGPRLLDVGAAYGFLLVAAREHGFEPLGVEPVVACATYAERELGERVLPVALEEADLPPASFDVITLFDVIEHLREPRAAIARVRELLRPGGIVVVETGDREALLARVCGRRWYYYDPPQHLTYFSQRSLVAMLRKAGFAEPAGVAHLGREVSLRNVSFQLARALGPGLFGRASRAISRSAAGRRTFEVPDRGNAFVLAARKG